MPLIPEETIERVKAATDIVEIEKPDGKKFMVPLTRQAVPGWDERTLTIAEGFWDR